MREALHAAAFERGQSVNLGVSKLPARLKQISAREILRIRRALNASQPLVASYVNVSPTPSAAGSKASAAHAAPPSSSSPSPRKIPKSSCSPSLDDCIESCTYKL
jgi:hypothetical protein